MKKGDGQGAKGISRERAVEVSAWQWLDERVTSAGENIVSTYSMPINGEDYRHTLNLDKTKDAGFIEWTLGRKCTELEATFGLSDRTETGGKASIVVQQRRRRRLRPRLRPRRVRADDHLGRQRLPGPHRHGAGHHHARHRAVGRRGPGALRLSRGSGDGPGGTSSSFDTRRGRVVLLPVVAGPDFDTEIKQLQATMHTIEQVLDLDGMRAEIAELGEQVAAPDLWDDQANAQRVTGRLSAAPGRARALHRAARPPRRPRDHGRARRRRRATPTPLAEAEPELARVKKAVEALEVRTLLSGEYDAREALVTIRSGAGGVDAADFAEMLMRMYTRWAERHKYPVEVFDTSYAEEAGLKSATFAVHAPYAYGTLSVEAGTHRLVRISPFDNQGRRQTSFAAVEVVPVLEQTDEIEIPDEDVRVDVYRSGGPGRPVGQHHRLRGPAHPHPDRHRRVSCQNEKSQLQNKASAMVILKAKLLALKKAEEKAHLDGAAR